MAAIMSGGNLEGRDTPEALARKALEGDRDALEKLAESLQADVFGLALRMLGHREDAEDAAQEILIRIVTRLAQFDFRSRLKTWAYRIAVNYVLDFRKSPAEKQRRSFRQLEEAIMAGLSPEAPPETERSLVIAEVKAACTLGMLQCLDRPRRAAYILGEIMELPGPEAARVLGIAPALFRKRLEQARAAMQAFLKSHCGLVSDTVPCRCNRLVPRIQQAGALPAGGMRLASSETSFAELRANVRRVEAARQALEVHRTTQPPAASVSFARRLMAALEVHLGQAGRL